MTTYVAGVSDGTSVSSASLATNFTWLPSCLAPPPMGLSTFAMVKADYPPSWTEQSRPQAKKTQMK